MLKGVGKTERGYLRSFEFHARHVLPGFQHLEVQSIVVLEGGEDEVQGSEANNRT